MFGRKKAYEVRVYSATGPKRLAKMFEDDANKMAKDGYVVDNVQDENVGVLGVTTHQVRTVTYRLATR